MEAAKPIFTKAEGLKWAADFLESLRTGFAAVSARARARPPAAPRPDRRRAGCFVFLPAWQQELDARAARPGARRPASGRARTSALGHSPVPLVRAASVPPTTAPVPATRGGSHSSHLEERVGGDVWWAGGSVLTFPFPARPRRTT